MINLMVIFPFWYHCRCYECGECGHLSYSCPKNILGTREPPKKKPKRKKKEDDGTYDHPENDDEETDDKEETNFEDESLSAAIRYQVIYDTLALMRVLTLKRRALHIRNKTTLHGQQREFCIRNDAQKTKENDVKTILISLAYLTPIKLPFCMGTGERERERVFKKKKKFKISQKPFYSQVNDKAW